MNESAMRRKRASLRIVAAAAFATCVLATDSTTLQAAGTEQPRLPRSTPEAQGISSSAILTFLAAVNARHDDALNSFMLVRHGHVVAEGWWAPYDAATPHALYSGTKSFTSMAVGRAIIEGRLRLDDHVLDFFPEQKPAQPDENLRAMRIRDLLTMSTGHEVEPPFRGNPELVRTFLTTPVTHAPGTHFLYNTTATDVLGIIVEKVTGKSLRDALQPWLFDPLGITELRWATLPNGATDGGIGLSIRTEDFACFGQLLLQRGQWKGKQLVPAAWVQTATSRQVATDPDASSDAAQGYGFQFWRCRHNAFRADGAFGQFCIVMPDQDAVVVITSGIMNQDMQSMLNLVWEHLLPAMQPGQLPENPADAARLTGVLTSAQHRPVAGVARSADRVQNFGRTYTFPANATQLTALKIEPGDDKAVTLVLRFNDGPEQRVVCGDNTWRKGRVAFSVFPDQPVAASAAWTADRTLVAKLFFYENPFAMTLTLKFSGDELTVEPAWNLALSPTQLAPVTGRANP